MTRAVAPISNAAAARSASLRPVMNTSAPSTAKRRAIPSPMPFAPPITRATLFDNLFIRAASMLGHGRSDIDPIPRINNALP